MLNYTDYFSATYMAARSKFRQAVSGVNGKIAHYVHPDALGALGEVLTIDVAHVGNPQGSKQLVMISGTHGLEGFAGSALQVGWLYYLAKASLASDVGVLLIHGLNPYGFSHGSRTNAGGVDLNRNFIDHSDPPRSNGHYEELHPYFSPSRWDAVSRSECEAATTAFCTKHGEDAYFDAFACGQYLFPDGVCYGGNEEAWENLRLQEILTSFIGHAEKVAVIDWHTGIGVHGRPFHLVFSERDSEARKQISNWWGDQNVNGALPNNRVQPNYKGLVFRGVEKFLPNSTVAGGVVELGTRGPIAADQAIRQDLWLRSYGQNLSEDIRSQLHTDLLDSLNPVSYLWRELVLKNGLPIIKATTDGLTNW